MIVIKRKRILFNLADLLGLVILYGAALMTGGPVGIDPGLGWHLATGRWIERYSSFPSHQLYLLPDIVPDAWVSDQWLADLVFYNLHDRGGLFFLHMLVVGLMSWIVLFPLRNRCLQISKSPFAGFVALLLVAALFSIQWIIRPVIFSFLFFSYIYLFITEDPCSCSGHNSRRYSWKDFVAILIIFFLWANLHPGFVLGLLLLGVNAGGFIIQSAARAYQGKRKTSDEDSSLSPQVDTTTCFQAIAILLVASLVTLANPYGFELHRSIFGLISNPYFTNLNQEWRSPNLLAPGFAILVIIPAALVMLAALGFHKTVPTKHLVLLMLFLYLGLSSIRFLPFLAIVLSLPLVISLDHFLTNAVSRGSPISRKLDRLSQIAVFSSFPFLTIAFWVLLVAFSLQHGTLPTQSPYDSKQLASEHDLEVLDLLRGLPDDTRLLHSPNYGGLIAWNLWPHLRGFIDDRNQIIRDEHYRSYFEIMRGLPGWQEAIEKYRFDTLLLEPTDPLRLLIDDSWMCKRSKSGYQVCRKAAREPLYRVQQ